MDRRLRAAALGGAGGERVEAVLEDVVVGRGERDRAELVHELVDAMILVGLIGGGGGVDELGGFLQRPAVERVELVGGDGVFRRIEVVEAGELVAERVAQEPVGLADDVEDARRVLEIGPEVGDADVLGEILRGDPEADHVGAILGDVVVGGRRFLVLAGLGDLLAVLADDEAVGEHGLVGRAAVRDHAGPERGLEPAAVLVAALEVQIGRPLRGALLALERGGVGGAGVDPDVERVATAGELVGGGPAGGKGDALEKLGGCGVVPEVGAAFGDLGGDGADDAGVEVGVLLLVVDRRDRHAPGALAADAPVGAGLDGAADALLAGLRHPRDVADFGEGFGARGGAGGHRLVERDEPLVDGAEDDRGLRAPAVRIAVLEILGLHERAERLELLDDVEVRRRGPLLLQHLDGLEGGEADEVGRHATVVDVAAVVADRAVDLELVAQAGLVVVLAVAGRGVDAAGAAVGRHVVGEHDRRGAIDEGMAGLDVLQLGAAHLAQHLEAALQAAIGGELLQQVAGNKEDLRTVTGEDVVELGMDGDGEVGRERPRRGRPDDDAGRHARG